MASASQQLLQWCRFSMDEKDLSQLKGMIERLGPKDPPDRARANFDKWAGQVAECIEHRDIIVIFSSQSGAGDDDEEDEAGIFIWLYSFYK